eukprot:766913-Hanusia_phi.AAC.2
MEEEALTHDRLQDLAWEQMQRERAFSIWQEWVAEEQDAGEKQRLQSFSPEDVFAVLKSRGWDKATALRVLKGEDESDIESALMVMQSLMTAGIEVFEQDEIMEVLRGCGWNKNEAFAQLKHMHDERSGRGKKGGAGAGQELPLAGQSRKKRGGHASLAFEDTASMASGQSDTSSVKEKEKEEVQEFKIGQFIEAKWRGGKKMYPGIISAIWPGGKYNITYDDGDSEFGVDKKMIRVCKDFDWCKQLELRVLEEGERVFGRWNHRKGEKLWYFGVVLRVESREGGGRYTIQYDDGDRESNVKRMNLQTTEERSRAVSISSVPAAMPAQTSATMASADLDDGVLYELEGLFSRSVRKKRTIFNVSNEEEEEGGERKKRRRVKEESEFFGVKRLTEGVKRGRIWMAVIEVGEEEHRLGAFKAEREAARAYDMAAMRFFGEQAQLNFPSSRKGYEPTDELEDVLEEIAAKVGLRVKQEREEGGGESVRMKVNEGGGRTCLAGEGRRADVEKDSTVKSGNSTEVAREEEEERKRRGEEAKRRERERKRSVLSDDEDDLSLSEEISRARLKREDKEDKSETKVIPVKDKTESMDDKQSIKEKKEMEMKKIADDAMKLVQVNMEPLKQQLESLHVEGGSDREASKDDHRQSTEEKRTEGTNEKPNNGNRPKEIDRSHQQLDERSNNSQSDKQAKLAEASKMSQEKNKVITEKPAERKEMDNVARKKVVAVKESVKKLGKMGKHQLVEFSQVKEKKIKNKVKSGEQNSEAQSNDLHKVKAGKEKREERDKMTKKKDKANRDSKNLQVNVSSNIQQGTVGMQDSADDNRKWKVKYGSVNQSAKQEVLKEKIPSIAKNANTKKSYTAVIMADENDEQGTAVQGSNHVEKAVANAPITILATDAQTGDEDDHFQLSKSTPDNDTIPQQDSSYPSREIFMSLLDPISNEILTHPCTQRQGDELQLICWQAKAKIAHTSRALTRSHS